MSPDQIAIAGVIGSAIAIVISIASVWYTRRSHLVATIPAVSLWFTTSDQTINFLTYGKIAQEIVITGHMLNHSDTVVLTDVSMQLQIITRQGLFRRKPHVFYEGRKQFIEAKDGWYLQPYSGKVAAGGYPIYDGIHEVLAKDEIGILKAINPDDPLFLYYKITQNKPITIRMQTRYKPGLYGSKYISARRDVLLSPITKSDKNGDLILVGWEMTDK